MCLTDIQSPMTNISLTRINSTKSNNDEILHVIYDYESKGDDELTLKRGSILEVLSKDEKISGSEGWWTGRLLDSESVGIFPANFVATSERNLRIIDDKDLQIGDLIGIGGFGHVHYGKFGDIDVAIKTAKSLASFNTVSTPTSSRSHDDDSSNAVHKNLIDGLLREARLFSHLNHRNIIQLFGVSPSISTRNLYLVMEYAHGGALSELLARRKTGLHPYVLIQYAQQIADGMRYLHEEAAEHIIHRDLKCSNVLILENIEDIHDDNELFEKTLKITDFGLARKQLQSSSMSTAGTFAWMSPECIRNNEFSTKSDVWSFGVLLWECLTGEVPYKGFDQMQVAFGVATNKYSLPIPSTCPEEFSQLMKDCWQPLPQDRPTFSELYTQITQIIEQTYGQTNSTDIESSDESYLSKQEDWKREIQTIFDELKTKEQEIRDREQAMLQLTIQQNHQRMQLEKWEHELHEREMHIIELELKLLMSSNNNNHQDRSHQPTPKVQKRSGRFMRSLLQATMNGHTNLSSTTASHVISSPTNFRHILSICRDNNNIHHPYHPSVEPGSSATLPHYSKSSSTPAASASSQTLPAKTSSNGFHTSNSTPTTPNLNRLRTLTFSEELIGNKTGDEEPLIFNEVHFPISPGDPTSPTTGKSARSSSIGQDNSPSATIPRSRWRRSKPWTQSSPLKRKHPKSIRHGEPKWYLEPIASIGTTDTNTAEEKTPSPEPITTDSPAPKLEDSDELSSSSCSTCSTPADRSLTRGIFDVNTVLTAFGFGRCLPTPSHSSPSSSITTTPKSIFRSTSETKTKTFVASSSSSANTTPSSHRKKQHKRTCSSPIQNTHIALDISPTLGHRARPCYSPVRPDSLQLSTIPPPPSTPTTASSSTRKMTDRYSDPDLLDRHFSLRNRSRTITSTPEEDERLAADDYTRFYSAQSSELLTTTTTTTTTAQAHSHRSHLLDIDTEEQQKHQTKVLPPEIDDKQTYVSPDTLERDFLS